MPFIGNQPALSYTSFAKQDFTTSATTSYTLDQPVANANELALFINFVRQEPTTAYTASGTTLTLTSATSATDDMYCVFLGKAVQTVNPPNGSVDSSKINYPLTTFSSTGIDDNATSTAVTIDNSGKVGIGDTTPAGILEVSDADNETYLFVTNAKSGGSGQAILALRNDAGNWQVKCDTNDTFKIRDNANSTDRLTIGSNGYAGIGTDSPVRKLQVSNGFIGASESSANITSNQYNEFADNSANWYNTKFLNYSASPASQYMLEISFVSASPDNSSAKFIEMTDSVATRCRINSDGDVYNHDGTYGTLSDERIKQNIVDASSQWEDIKNIRVRKYKKKDDVLQYGEENAPIEIGVISQELETVSPGLIKEQKPNSSHAELHEDFAGENPQNVKYVKYSILYMKSIKALQEAMERIEQLETKNTELEARITQLENA